MSERELLIRVKVFSYDVYNCVKKIKPDIYNKQLIEQLIDSALVLLQITEHLKEVNLKEMH